MTKMIDIIDKAHTVKALSDAMLMAAAGAHRVAVEIEDEENALTQLAYILTDEATKLVNMARELQKGRTDDARAG